VTGSSQWYRGDRLAALEAVRVLGSTLNVGAEARRANYIHEAVDGLNGVEELSAWHFQGLSLMEAYRMLGEYQRELPEAEGGWEVCQATPSTTIRRFRCSSLQGDQAPTWRSS
jgi:hypothetical protein